MSSFPYFTNVDDHVIEKINNRKGNINELSKLNAWIRVASGAGDGLMLYSNPSFNTFRSAGDDNVGSIYGNSTSSGVLGVTWTGKPVYVSGQGYQPSPVITGVDIDEGESGDLSRKANFSITAYTKEQADELMSYFLEPGFSVFIEWGWNTNDSVIGWQSNLTGEYVSNFESLVYLSERRRKAKGDYDAYLGFISGGSVSLSDGVWNISVSCHGYPELAAYLTTSETGEDSTNVEEITPDPPEHFGKIDIRRVSPFDLGRIRFMKMFNELPDTRKTVRVQSLIDELSSIENFINFDDDVAQSINGRTDGALFGLVRNRVRLGDGQVVLPIGTKLISPNRYIKFSAFMSILNAIGVEGLQMANGKVVKYKINSKNTYCVGFNHMFSLDPTKLFIPNPQTPKFKPKENGLSLEDVSDNSVNGIVFPESTPLLVSGKFGERIKSDAFKWGRLDNLYVNYDFAASVIETKNFVIKDALYQILNGMSSAVNSLWDFQIIVKESDTDDVTELTIVDMNFTSEMTDDVALSLYAYGEQSVFISSNMDLSISGAKMNQIIAQRYDVSINQQGKDFPNAFSEKKDLVVNDIKASDTVKKIKTEPLDDSEMKQEAIDVILNRLFLFPRVEFSRDSELSNKLLYYICYVGAFKDTETFAKLKKKELGETKNRTALLPIEFSFTIHGISGIRRGDMFRIRGLPKVYDDGNSFFQVLAVKHTVSDMVWTTEIKGGWRV